MPSVLPAEIDVAVVGAGPGGCAAALGLARRGVGVALIERAAMPRYKTCGGGLVERARRQLEVDVAPVLERSCELVELGLEPCGRRLEVRRPRGIVHMAMRAVLDQRLAGAAQEAGARLVESCEVRGLELEPAGLRLGTTLGEVRARLVVAADGLHSRVARLAGWPAQRALAPALECEVEVEPLDQARLSRSARFDLGLPAHGYAWVFPKRSHLSIGVVSMRRGPADLDAALRAYLERLGIPRPRSLERHGWAIPLAPRPGGPARGRVLLVGDAAGLADPVTAEGIGPALQSGRIAAAAIADAELDADRSGRLHRERLAGELLRELRAGRRLAGLLYGRPRLRELAFALHGRALAEAMADVVTGERSYTSLLRSPASWLRLLLPRGAPPADVARGR